MSTRQNRWIRVKLDQLKEEYGGKCWNCGSTVNLEFAHVKETGLSGKGRGRHERYFDIKAHPDAYALLCGGENGMSGCHEMFDNGLLSLDNFFQVIKR